MSVSNAETGTTTYTYDAVGNLASVTYPNGVIHSYAYDTRNRLTNLGVNNSTGALASYAYTLEPAGHRTRVVELSGRTVNYSYDDLFRLTGETISGDPAGQNGAITYRHDAVGNRLEMTSTVPAIPAGLFFYDQNDRLTSDVYDSNGNTVSSGGINYAYDFENRLIQKGDGIFIAYDGDGNRVRKTVAGVTTTYLVDELNPTGFSQVMVEVSAGLPQRQYVYGLDLISQRRRLPTGFFAVSFYGYDGHGSVRQLTDTTGAVTDAYTYDAFGNLIARTGTTPNNYLYAGEQFDPDLGLYYNRARYLDVRTGRFWSMDPFEGIVSDPRSLHKYLYAANDSINKVDPSGRTSLGELVQFSSVITTLANVSIASLSLVSAAFHDFSLDGVLFSVRGNYNTSGGTIGGGVDIIWQRSTNSFHYALVSEFGTAPLSLFKLHRGAGLTVTFGPIVGMNTPSEMSGWAITAVFPAAIAHLLPGAFLSENKVWGAITQLAKRASHTNIRDFVLGAGLSSSGPSYAVVGVRSNSFSSLVSFAGEYRPAAEVIGRLRELAGPIFDGVAAGMFSSAASMASNADAILSLLRASN